MREITIHALKITMTASIALLLLLCSDRPLKKVAAHATAPSTLSPNVSVFATGLNNPRGLKFGPDGNLYVAEGGVGGTDTTVGQCDQVLFPVGPYTGSTTGSRISKIDSGGNRTTVADNLPSSQTGPALGFLVSGAQDVAFIGNTLYVMLSGAGCSHGVASIPNAVLRVNSNGSTTQVANLSAYLLSHSVAHPDLEDFEPDGTWYSMIAVNGNLYVTEPNHGELDKITTSGQITRVIDVSASQGHIVPTALAYNGNFFFSNLGTFPIIPGTETIFKLTPSGQLKPWATGLTTVLGLVIDQRDRTYVLESMTEPGFPGPSQFGSGKVVKIEPDGTQTVIAEGLSFPSAMTLGPDGALYVSNIGFGAPPVGLGQIVRIEIPN